MIRYLIALLICLTTAPAFAADGKDIEAIISLITTAKEWQSRTINFREDTFDIGDGIQLQFARNDRLYTVRHGGTFRVVKKVVHREGDVGVLAYVRSYYPPERRALVFIIRPDGVTEVGRSFVFDTLGTGGLIYTAQEEPDSETFNVHPLRKFGKRDDFCNTPRCEHGLEFEAEWQKELDVAVAALLAFLRNQ